MTSTFGRSLGQSMSSPQLGLSASMEGIPNLPGFRQSPATPKQVKQSLRVQHGYMLVRSGVPLRPITAPAPGTVAVGVKCGPGPLSPVLLAPLALLLLLAGPLLWRLPARTRLVLVGLLPVVVVLNMRR